MDCLITAQELRVIGGLAFVFVAVAFWVDRTSIRRTDLNGFKRAGLALQRSGSADVVREAVREKNSPDRDRLREGLRRDFVLILSYAALFVSLGLLLSQAHTSGARWLGITAAVAALAAAGFDVIENYRTFQILSLEKDSIPDSLSSTVRSLSTCKWLLLFLAAGLEGVILVKLMQWYSLVGVVMVISAVVGIAGIRFHQILPPASLALGIAMFALGVVFVFFPHRVLRVFC